MDFSKIGVRLLVREYGKMYDFYHQTMGLQVVWGDRNGPYTSFAAPGQEPNFAIFAAEDMALFEGYTARPGPGGDQVMLVVPTTDVDADYARLKAAGAEFLGEPQTIDAWGMRCVVLRDPEGNMIELNNSGSA